MPAQVLTKVQRQAREKAIIQDLKGGQMSYRQIAAKHKVSLPTVNSKARKAGITRSRRGPAALKAVKGTAKRGRPAKKQMVKKTRVARAPRAVAARAPRRTGGFRQQFRELVMKHYPNISLRDYDRLTQAIERSLP